MTAPVAVPNDVVKVSALRALARLPHRPLRAFETIGRECNGALAELSLGPTRAYLATHPEHVQQVLVDNDTYRREGMLWKELQRLEGNGLAGEGPLWRRSRRMVHPLLSARGVRALLATTAAAVDEALDGLAEHSRTGRPVTLLPEMTRITHRVLIRAFFSDRISIPDADRLGHAISQGLRIIRWRLLMPFVSHAIPLPGDRTFRRAVETIDAIVYPLIRAYRAGATTGDQPADDRSQRTDLVAMFANAVDEAGQPLDEKRVRDDVVAMFVAGTEATATTLTWLFLLLDRHPEVAAGVAAEAREVVGDGPLHPDQLPGLVRTRMALEETLRLYPAGWLIPRRVARPTTISGVNLSPGDTILLSPYLTHRLPAFWDRPHEFRPERFAPEQGRPHKFAYLPFGAGAHQCLGNHFALLESQLAVAGLFSRFRPRLAEPIPIEPRMAAILQPRSRPLLALEPRR